MAHARRIKRHGLRAIGWCAVDAAPIHIGPIRAGGGGINYGLPGASSPCSQPIPAGRAAWPSARRWSGPAAQRAGGKAARRAVPAAPVPAKIIALGVLEPACNQGGLHKVPIKRVIKAGLSVHPAARMLLIFIVIDNPGEAVWTRLFLP